MKSYRIENLAIENLARRAGKMAVVFIGLPALLSSSPASISQYVISPFVVSSAHADGISYDSPHLSPGLRPGTSRQREQVTAPAPEWSTDSGGDDSSASSDSVIPGDRVQNSAADGVETRSVEPRTSGVSRNSGPKYARGERREAALAHYARARSMLLESLAEFERAREIARPDLIINSEEWRDTVATRARELDKVLNPKGRDSEAGVRLSDQPSLVRESATGGKSSVRHAPLSTVTGPNLRPELPRARLSNDTKASNNIIAPARKAGPSIDDAIGSAEEAAPGEAGVAEPAVKQVELPKKADVEGSVAIGEDSASAAEDTIPMETVATPAASASSVDEAELRERLKKLAEEVQAKEKAEQANVEPSNVGGMSR